MHALHYGLLLGAGVALFGAAGRPGRRSAARPPTPSTSPSASMPPTGTPADEEAAGELVRAA